MNTDKKQSLSDKSKTATEIRVATEEQKKQNVVVRRQVRLFAIAIAVLMLLLGAQLV